MVGLLSFQRLNLKQILIAVICSAACGFATSLAQAQPAPVAIKPPKATAPKVETKKPVAAAKPAPAKSDLLFEGYSKIMLGTTHIGYTVQRFEFDPKKKEYSTVYYLKTQPPANDVIESLKARSTLDLKPISYQYTELASGRVHIVDATFANGIMSVSELVNGKRTAGAPKKVPPGTFLASFLGYLMLQQKEAVKVGNKYDYQAIAEEDGGMYKGDAFIKGQETTKGLPTFKILNTYKGVQFVSFMTPQGEVLATDSAAQGISTELVANIQEATKGMSVNSNQLAQLFGSVPQGQDNAISRHAKGEPLGGAPAAESAPAATSLPAKSKQETLEGEPSTKRTKTEGVPQGNGIEVKPKKTEGQ
jgi:hypothetical protein